MRAQFIKGQDPKVAMGLGKRHTIELPSGRDIEGPFLNKKKAKKLLEKLNDEINIASYELEEEGIYDDEQMDALDEIVEEYMEYFRKLGYEYIDD